MVRFKNKNSISWKIKKFIKNWFLIDLLALIYFILEFFYRKNPNRILFFFGKEEAFADNSRVLFEYMHHKADNELVLFIYKKELYLQLKELYPENTHYAYSLKGLFCFLKSRIIILSYGTDKLYFFPYYFNLRYKTVIQLWHGSLFKRLGFQVTGWNKIKGEKELQKFSKFIACSSLERFMISSCFNMHIDDIWITDYPRNDKLFQTNKQIINEFPYLDKKVILYAPTWREEGRKTVFFPFEDVNLKIIQSFLEETDSYLLIRTHREEMDNFRKIHEISFQESNRIIGAGREIFPHTEDLLPYVDILITDYSGIYNDFLLLNRPIIFIPYDIDDYSTYRGVLFDYNKFTAGPKITSQKHFLTEIRSYYNNWDKDKELRVEMQKTFHDNIDGNACERILLKLKTHINYFKDS